MKALLDFTHLRQAHLYGLVWALLALLMPVGNTQAQGCTAFERELEAWLRNYQPGQGVNVPRLERIRAQCTSPSDKLELIYYYLRACDALYQPGRDMRLAYEDATHYYDLCATYFPYLIEAPAADEDFSAYFFARAEGFEQTLRQAARQLGLRPENRYYGETAAAEAWRAHKEGLQSETNMRTRGQGGDQAAFQKNVLRQGQYISHLPSESDPNGTSRGGTNLRTTGQDRQVNTAEAYGFVGQVSDLNIFSYLAWNQDREPVFPVAEEPGAAELSRLPGPATPAPQPAYTAEDRPTLISAFDRLSLRAAPGDNAVELAVLGFGQTAFPVASTQAVRSQDRTYIQVQLSDGRTGWIDSGRAILDGHIAVLTRSLRGYPISTDRTSDRGALLFQGGEIVILEDARQQNGIDWVKVVSRNAQKHAWIAGIDGLSIEDLDLEIGQALYLASLENSLFARKARLEAIRQWPGYRQSPLAPVVEQQLQQLYAASR